MLSGLQLGEPVAEEQDPYLPFPLVPTREQWVQDERQLQINDPGVYIANGVLPHANIGGLVEFDHEIAAFDLIGIKFITDKEIRIFPTAASAVTHEGEILAEGFVGLMTKDGKLRISGACINFANHPWPPVELKPPKTPRPHSSGGLVMRALCPLDRLDFDIEGEDFRTGGVEATYRRRFF